MENTGTACETGSKEIWDNLNAKRRLYQFHLTEEETEVLEFILQGLTNKEIAEKLCKSIRTVEGRRARLMKKTGSHNLAQLMQFARHHNLI